MDKKFDMKMNQETARGTRAFNRKGDRAASAVGERLRGVRVKGDFRHFRGHLLVELDGAELPASNAPSFLCQESWHVGTFPLCVIYRSS